MSLDAYLAAHHEVVDLAALAGLGRTAEFARAQVAAGRWQRVHPAVFCGYTGPLTFASRCEAALRHCGAGSALDAATAARLHGLRGFEPATTEVVVPHTRRVRAARDVVVRRSRTLSARSVVRRGGLTVVTAERAILGTALTRPVRARAVLAASVQQGLSTPERLRGCLLGLGPVRHKRLVLAALADVEGGSRSWLEVRFRRLVVEAGLPAPVQQYALLVGGRRVWLDACYPDRRVAIEIDGRAYHLMSEDWEDDLARQNEVVLAGWLVLRFTARDLRERPKDVVAAVRRALDAPWGTFAVS